MLLGLTCVCLSAVTAAAQEVATPASTGAIRGVVRDGNTPVPAALVFVLDAQTGFPVKPHTQQCALKRFGNYREDFWYTLADEQGRFAFDNVLPGAYRLLSQSWEGMAGMPSFRDQSPETIHLHGIAQVTVHEDRESHLVIESLGSATLRLENDPKEAGAFLFVSSQPTLGDPILAWFGWGPGFIANIIGVQHMTSPAVTVRGLPEHKDVHVTLFAYDNNPGFGGGTFRPDANSVHKLAIYSTWSNGHHDPPARLAALVEHVGKKGFAPPPLIAQVHERFPDFFDPRGFWKEYAEPNREVTLPGFGSPTLLDLMAALAYHQLDAQHRAQNDRQLLRD
jgi:hypothetical protein